jgi:hypothetical protein
MCEEVEDDQTAHAVADEVDLAGAGRRDKALQRLRVLRQCRAHAGVAETPRAVTAPLQPMTVQAEHGGRCPQAMHQDHGCFRVAIWRPRAVVQALLLWVLQVANSTASAGPRRAQQ